MAGFWEVESFNSRGASDGMQETYLTLVNAYPG